MTAPVDVLAVLRRMQHTCDLDRRDNQIDGLANLDAELAGEESEAIAAVAELIACNAVTVKAFEALGRTDNIVAQLESHRECERALVEQKAALARVQGGAA